MKLKGFTVHYDKGGNAACGVSARSFAGKKAVSTNLRYVTCAKCERLANRQPVEPKGTTHRPGCTRTTGIGDPMCEGCRIVWGKQ